MDAEQQKDKEALLKHLSKLISDVSCSISGNTKWFEFKVDGAQLKSFKKDFVQLKLKVDNTPPPSTKDNDQKTSEIPIQQAKQIEKPKPKPKPKPEPEPEVEAPKQTPKLKSKTSSNKSNKKPKEKQKKEDKLDNLLDTEPPRERSPSPIAPAQSLEAKHGAIGAIVPEAKVPDDKPKLVQRSSSNKGSNKGPKLRKRSSAKKPGASKAVFGTLKSGREKRLHLGNKDTFNGCEYIPQFKGSERGCILKKGNSQLDKRGIVKKSQIDKFNGVEVSSESLKKIKKMIKDYCKLGKDYTIQFEIPEIELNTIELTFCGGFCPAIDFTKEYDGNNMIIKDIKDNDTNKYLINKAEIKVGYRIFKVKGQNVLNKSYKEIKTILDKAGNDIRVSYQVVFIEGNMNWYNFTDPNVFKDDDEKKIDLPKMRSNKSGSNKSPRKTPRRTPKSSFNTPITPSTPSAKDPKYFLRDKKNVTAYMDIRIDGDKRGRLEIVLFMGIVPKTATNFLKLCTGENKKKLSYKGKKFYKMYVGMALEGGDVENNDGSGKSSIYGGYFDDENFKIRHKQYCLSMKNKDEPNTNASQFYIVVTEDADYLDGQNVVFGYISDKKSQELVNDMEEEGCSLTGKPKCKAVVYKCGKLKK